MGAKDYDTNSKRNTYIQMYQKSKPTTPSWEPITAWGIFSNMCSGILVIFVTIIMIWYYSGMKPF